MNFEIEKLNLAQQPKKKIIGHLRERVIVMFVDYIHKKKTEEIGLDVHTNCRISKL